MAERGIQGIVEDLGIEAPLTAQVLTKGWQFANATWEPAWYAESVVKACVLELLWVIHDLQSKEPVEGDESGG